MSNLSHVTDFTCVKPILNYAFFCGSVQKRKTTGVSMKCTVLIINNTCTLEEVYVHFAYIYTCNC